jgi:acyl-coenzyme A synthetase/AMP-(fatty) acid ligase
MAAGDQWVKKPPDALAAGVGHVWASPSTKKPGTGTTNKIASAKNAAPSWIPGGKPKPAASSLRRWPVSRPLKPCYATLPHAGRAALPRRCQRQTKLKAMMWEGMLCIKYPWPSIMRTTYGDHERCRQTYFATFKDKYFTGDGARRDPTAMYRIIGRVDDVINVSGHRIGTAEVEDAINKASACGESAVVGYPHDIKGQGIYAYVITTGCRYRRYERRFQKEVLDVP